MSSMPTVNVTPVSGSGWVVAGVPRELPSEPFTVALISSEPKRCLGLVLDNGHEFVGRHVELKKRSDGWTGKVAVIVEPAGPGDRRATGPGLTCAAPCASPC